jgi:hypothetical protein
MGKLTLEADETRLKQKVSGKRGSQEKADGDAAIRGLRKHLKRVQRKRRRLALRKQHAKPKQTAASTPPPAPAG